MEGRRLRGENRGNEKETLLLFPLLFLQEQGIELMQEGLGTIFGDLFFPSFRSFDRSVTPNAGVHIRLWRGGGVFSSLIV